MSNSLHFPYMFWAHHEAALSPYCLSQSGMPVPPVDFLGGLQVDIGHPCVDALPALTRRLGELYGVQPERVLVTVGASSAMHLAAMRWFGAGSRVAVEVPSYEPLRALPQFYGAELRALERHQETRWDLEPSAVRSALQGATGRGHVFLSNPHNPSGAMLDAERLKAIAAEAQAANGLLVSCEIYQEFVPPKRRVHAFDVAPNGVTISGLTKAYGLGGLRIGWMILGEQVAEEMLQVTDMSYMTYLDPPTASLVAARIALDHLPALLQPLARISAQSRPIWEKWLRVTPGVSSFVPEFGIIAFPRIRDVGDSAALASFLQSEFQVDVVPGEYFGRPGHLRVSCGVPAETLRLGLEQLAKGIEAFKSQNP